MQAQQTHQHSPFHLAIPTHDLQLSKKFYGEILGCPQGRTDPQRWIDYNFFGSQLVAHYASNDYHLQTHFVSQTPIPNFGVFINDAEFQSVQQKLKSHNVKYSLLSSKNEQIKSTLHVQDPTGNNLLFHNRK